MIKKTLSLRHDFSENEINDIAHTLTDCLKSKGVIIVEKQQVNKRLNAEIKYWDKQIDDNSNLISEGFTHRDVACSVEFNKPVAGQKIITRLDTNDYWQEPMTMDEFDLFNNMNVPTQDNDFEEAEVLTLGEGLVSLPFEEEE